jgi:hypothetical protein
MSTTDARRRAPLASIWRVVKAHVAASVKSPQTIHYRGQGVFTVAGRTINRRRNFKPQNL